MNDSGDPRLAAVERRLERCLPEEPAPALRHRVLMAVDDLLTEKVPATKSRQSAQAVSLSYPYLVAGTILLALFVTVSAGAVAATLRPAAAPSLVARLRAAGVTDDELLDLAAAPPAAAAPPPQTGLPRPVHPAVHWIKVRKLLEEHL
jgi:hypothetical protein